MSERGLESQLAQLAGRAQPSEDGWDRIMVRARRRDRRRRAALSATGVVALAVAALTVPRLLHPGVTQVHAESPPPASWPAVQAPPGQAAWVAAGLLWVFTGSGAPLAVSGSAGAEDPEWSPDRQWISYLRDTGTTHTELWVVHPDGSAKAMLWSGEPGGIEWSPTADVLAVSDSPAVGVGGLQLVATDGTARQVVPRTVEVQSFTWSPDGTSIALSEVVRPVATYRSPLVVLTVQGPAAGTATVVLRAGAGDGILVGPWWPDRKGVLYWIEPQYSKAAEAEGLALMSTPVSGGASVSLGTALVDPLWLAWTGAGQLFVVLGGGPSPSAGKSLELCSPTTGTCRPVPVPAGRVSLDPALSPDGRQVAFVVARASTGATASWYASRTLWVADLADLADGHPVSGASAGAAVPSWCPSGLMIGYTTATGVEAIGASGGRVVVVSGPVPLAKDLNFDGETAYGKSPWTGHAVWAPLPTG